MDMPTFDTSRIATTSSDRVGDGGLLIVIGFRFLELRHLTGLVIPVDRPSVHGPEQGVRCQISLAKPKIWLD